jgi:hypothetical protein
VKKYIAAPGADVIGSQILVTVDALGAFKNTGYRYLEECGLSDIKLDQWYSQQSYCDLLETIETKTGKATLVVVGTNVAAAAKVHFDIDTVEKWMASAAQVYQRNHRNVPKNKGWAYKMTGPSSAILTCNEPYPDSFIRGLADGFVRRFQKDPNRIVSIRIDETQSRRDNGGAWLPCSLSGSYQVGEN